MLIVMLAINNHFLPSTNQNLPFLSLGKRKKRLTNDKSLWTNTCQAQTQPPQILQKVYIKILLNQKILKPKNPFFLGGKTKYPKN